MLEFPVMGKDDAGVIHRIGRGAENWWTACGLPAEELAGILTYDPTCPKCIDALEQTSRLIDGDA
jgi:hypothetical protein